MPLQLQTCTAADMPTFDTILHAAFRSGMASKLSPHPLTPDAIQESIDYHTKALTEEPDITYLKVVDTDSGETISCAKWRINRKERTWEEVERGLPKVGDKNEKWNEKSQAERDFLTHLRNERVEWMGTKPFYLLQILITHPSHERRGAGTMLLNWGLEQADRDGLPTYLEGSQEGRPLYERLGFKPVKEVWFDMGDYGGEKGKKECNTIMIRPVGGKGEWVKEQ